ncbi:hypothetical protein HMPREF9012_1657 [Bacteroidetes bacterium oral taxon 272 str. F0290]|nr:hypothetical protein HMPREF9012_1657 [Bacteroidetes bacterium oral taxon 272 str. F0290]
MMKNSKLTLIRVFLGSIIFFWASICSFGKERKVLYAILTLKDSTVVEGYLRSSSLNVSLRLWVE